MNILIAEDEKDINNLIKLTMEQEGFQVFAARDGLEAFMVLKKEKIDLAIFDVMMPKLDGFNLLRKVREDSTLPVIFLTARGEEMDKVLGFGIGADDYLVKPFLMSELVARVHALLRRSLQYSVQTDNRSKVYQYRELTLDIDGCCLYKNNQLIELNAKEYQIIRYLMENPSRVFTKKQLYMAIWKEELYYDDNTIMVHVSHLRNKIEEDSKNPSYIKTIRGIGYKFTP